MVKDYVAIYENMAALRTGHSLVAHSRTSGHVRAGTVLSLTPQTDVA